MSAGQPTFPAESESIKLPITQFPMADVLKTQVFGGGKELDP